MRSHMVCTITADTAGSDPSFLVQVVDWGITRFFPDGIKMNFDQAPVVTAVKILNKVTVTAGTAGDELKVDMGFSLNIPLIGIFIRDYITFDIPKLTMQVEDLKGEIELKVTTSSLEVKLVATVTKAAAKCNPLLSSIVFNRPALLPGFIKLGTKVSAFPCNFNIKQDMWVQASLLDASQSVIQGAFQGSQADGSDCGWTATTLTGKMCIKQGKSIKCSLENTGLNVSVAVAMTRAAVVAPFSFQLAGGAAKMPLDDSSCVEISAMAPLTQMATGAAQQAACAVQRGLPSTGLGLDYPTVMLTDFASCKKGINACTHKDGADKWDTVVSNRKLKLCLPFP